MNVRSKTNILVVEDSPELLEVYARLIRALGVEVLTASNGRIAWDILQNTEVDVVFSDIRMPEMDGVELLKKIRARNKISPCVLMTSGFSEYPSDMLLDLGANGFMAKPTGAQAIKDAMKRAFLKIEDRWAHPTAASSTIALVKHFKSFAEMVETGEVRFGNGGFFVKLIRPDVSVGSVIDFDFTFDDPSLVARINGAGLVQWVHLADTGEPRPLGMGIEIKYLADSCRASLCQWILQQKFDSYIPLK